MLVFLDFEASSLSDVSYPIEIGWVFEDGASESHIIRPAPGWEDWDPAAEAIHGMKRAELIAHGRPHGEVAERMIAVLSGHDLHASAPSWDGKWLSALLRAAGLPRHSLRLRDTDDALRATASAILSPVVPAAQLPAIVARLLVEVAAASTAAGPPAHRALADAREEHRLWLLLRDKALAAARDYRAD